MRILAGDIGGTKSLLALVEAEGNRLRFLREARLESRSGASLGDLARDFLGGETAERACFGIAGPVAGGACEGPNLPWPVRASEVARATGVPRTLLVNDFEAVGYGIERLEAADCFMIQVGEADPAAPVALIGAGTGLGEALVLPSGEERRVLPTEGGHADFAPRTETEIGLLRFFRERLGGRVSVERVLSGAGLVAIYEYAAAALAPADPEVRAEMKGSDPAAVVSRSAMDGRCEACRTALDLFVSLYGAEAGNLALRSLARGGVYVGGGIAPRILPKLEDGTFLRAFLDKGRFSSFLARVPVHVILSERAPLLGAAVLAQRVF